MMHHAGHRHDHSEDDWAGRADQLELEATTLLPYIAEAASTIARISREDGVDIRRVFDVGSGPGVATCELARHFPEAEVIAIDASSALLDRVAARAAAAGLSDRVTTHVADLQDGLTALGTANLIWAAMVMHHIGDEVSGLRTLRRALSPRGLLTLTEHGDPTRYLPDDAEPGLFERMEAAGASWLAAMRADLPGATTSRDYPTMMRAAGFEVLVDRTIHVRHAPMSPVARRTALAHLQRAQETYGEPLTDEDRRTLGNLIDENHPLGIMKRPDAFLDTSRHLYIGRASGNDAA